MSKSQADVPAGSSVSHAGPRPQEARGDSEKAATLQVGSAAPPLRGKHRRRRRRSGGRQFQSPVPTPSQETERRTRRASISIQVLAFLAAMYTVYFARAVLLPVTAAVVLALLFRPMMRRVRRYRIPDSVSAAVLLLLLVVIFVGVAANLVAPAKEWLTDAPQQLRAAGEKLHVVRQQIAELNEATAKMQRMAAGEEDPRPQPDQNAPFPFATEAGEGNTATADNAEPAAPAAAGNKPDSPTAVVTDRGGSLDGEPGDLPKAIEVVEAPIPVEVRQPRLMAGIQLLSSTGTVLADVVITLVLTYFLLVSGDMLINNILHLLPSYREKRNTVELVHKVQQDISSYLVTVTCINVVLGFVVAIAMWLLGVPNPLLWGGMATLFNFVPFLGALVGVAVMFLVSILAFDSLSYACVPPFVYWLLTSIEGNFVTPALLGRSMSLNPIMVFLSLTLLGWMWGIAGAVLAVPVLAIVKVGCDQFERSQAVGTLLGGSPTE